MVEQFLEAALTVLQWENLILVILGFLVGHLFGLIPGLSSLVALPILIPYSYNMSFYSALVFLISIMGGSTFAGSITSILLGIPGQGMNVMTVIDGHPLALQGKGAMAIGASATASAMGSLFSLGVLVLIMPFISNLILSFGPPECFVFIIIGFVAIALASRDKFLKSLISAGVGLLISLIGYNTVVGGTRFTFGIDYLWSGISMVPMFIGMYGVAEFISVTTQRGRRVTLESTFTGRELWQGIASVFKHWFLWLRCSLIGLIVGAIPGLGGIAATIISYSHAVQTEKNPERFGKGDIRGVIAPEASNNAKDGGQLMPTLALGVPGGPEMTFLLAAFLIHGIKPGTNMFEADVGAVWVIIVAYVLSNVFTSIFGMALGGQLVKLVALPPSIYMSIVVAMGLTGAYVSNYNVLDVVIALAFGVLGFAFRVYGFPVEPFTIAYILGPLVEQFYFQSLQIARGNYSVFISHSLTVVFLWSCLLLSIIYYVRRTRKPSPLG